MLIDADPLRDLLILRPGGEASYDLLYSAKLNDGFALLRQIVTPEDRISVIDFCNPFSFGLQQKSAEISIANITGRRRRSFAMFRF